MRIYGKASRKSNSVFYSVRDHVGHKSHMCPGVCGFILAGGISGYNDDSVLAWGYDGKSPDLLSVGLIFISISGKKSCFEFSFGGYPLGLLERNRPTVISSYRLFTQQITSQLPDNWEMTTDEIEAWIKDHKRLPACIRKQTKTKGKQYGKEETKEREGSVTRR